MAAASSPSDPRGLRLCLALLALVGRLVPASMRADWQREWEAEVRAAWRRLERQPVPAWNRSALLLRRTSGSVWDAAWLRRQVTSDADLVHDWRHASRLLRRAPAHTLLAVLVFALGIGTTTAVVSVADSFLLRTLPYRDADRIVTLWQTAPARGVEREEVAPANFLDWRERATSFEILAGFEPWSFDYTSGAEPEVLFAGLVTERFFEALGVTMALGRGFHASEHVAGARRVVVISHAAWQNRFGAEPGIVGRALVLDGEAYTVVGVLPPDFRPRLDSDGERDAWAPRIPRQGDRQTRASAWWAVVGRLRPGGTIAQAQAEMDTIAARLADEYPRTNNGSGVAVLSFRDHLVGTLRPALYLLTGAVVLVLAIACANVASLLLARGVERERELAVRAALGAGPNRLVRQLLAETALLALLGAAGGAIVARLTRDLIVALGPWGWSEMPDVVLDWRAWGVAAAATILAACAAGLAPALQLARPRPDSSLRTGERTTANPRSVAVRHGLVVAELALALVLLSGAGLLLRSFTRLVQVDTGFTRDNLVAAQIFAVDAYRAPEQRVQFYRRVVESVQRLPGVTAAGAVSAMPFGIADLHIRGTFTVRGEDVSAQDEAPSVAIAVATPGYLPAMQIPVLRGRGFTDDDRRDTARVAVVTRALAERHWSGRDPVGLRLQVTRYGRSQEVEVVGVVGDVRYDGLDREPRPSILLPHAQAPDSGMTIVARGTGDPDALVASIKRSIWEVEPTQAIYSAAPVQAWIDRTLADRRFSMVLVTVFAGLALVLASVGLYGIMRFIVEQRTREIGIRVVLGASPRDVLGAVLVRGVLLTAVGLGIGLAASIVLGRALQGFLYDVSPADPLALGGVTAVLALVSLAACAEPARRALTIDPAAAMRQE